MRNNFNSRYIIILSLASFIIFAEMFALFGLQLEGQQGQEFYCLDLATVLKAILTGKKLQRLYENPMSNNFR